MNVNNLVVYLPFDESTTQDLCGNTWSASGSPVIQDQQLYLDGSSYIQTNDVNLTQIFNSDFTLCFYMKYISGQGFFSSGLASSITNSGPIWQTWYSNARFNARMDGAWKEWDIVPSSQYQNSEHLFAITRKDNTLYFFFDGVLKKTYTAGTFTCDGDVILSIGKLGKYLSKLYMRHFTIYSTCLWTENFTPPTDEDYEQLKRVLGKPFSLEADMERVITNAAWKPSMNLKAWLPFNRTPTEDLCGNEWTLNGDATIEETGAINGNALQVTNATNEGQYGWLGISTPRLSMNGGITLGGQSFTIKICANFSVFPNRWNGGYGEIFVLSPTAGGILNDLHSNPSTIFLSVDNKGYLYSGCLGVVDSIIKLELNQTYAFEYVYSHSDGKVFIFLDGQKVNTIDVIIPETVFPNVLIDYAHWSANHPTAAIDEFRIYDGAALHTENFIPLTAENYIQQMLEQEGQAAFGYSLNTERVLTNNRKPINPYIAFTGANGCYGEVPLETLAGKSTFTIEAKFSTESTANSSANYSWKTIIGRELPGSWQDDFGLCVNNGKLCFWAEPKLSGSTSTCNTTTEIVVNDGAIHKVAVVAFDGAIDLYCDGEKVAHTDNVNAKIPDAYQFAIASNINNGNSYLKMNFYEARLWSVAKMPEQIFADIQGIEKGLEAWYIPDYRTDIIPDLSRHERHVTLYGSPAVSFEYEQIFDYAADVEFLIFNAANEFKYSEEIGVGLTFLESLDLTMSKTGNAFYQTTLERCFNLPPLPEVWIEFDVYFDGTHRWRAFNGGANGTTGIMAQTSKQLSFLSNGNNVGNFANVCPANQLRTMRLHMKTGAIDGVIEAWVDGQFINKYIGDVNHGELFEDLYLQSDGMDTCFSNFRISNVGFSDSRYLMLDFNLERRVKNLSYVISSSADDDEKIQEMAQPDDENKTQTGTAYYFGEIVKVFDLPPTYEIWIDFDVYFDGENIWRAGNVSPTYGICGITSSIDGTLNYLSNGEDVKAFPNLCKVNTIQPVLLHMISGIDDGIIEVWVDGEYVYQYVGDVNYGEDFCDIFLQSDGAGTLFSNITFSNLRLEPRIYIPPINLCVQHNGTILSFLLKYSETPKAPAFAVHYDGKNWYNLLVEPNNTRAGAVRIWHDGVEYALTKG